jgi:hypothetical protein
MNYQKHYNQLIARANNRLVDGYCESHHIIPRCLGGDDSTSNLVNLTAREHFIAHLLLVKIYPKNKGLICAVQFMCAGQSERKHTNRTYGWIRKQLSLVMSELQSQEGNSQWGTRWIHNLELKQSKKIDANVDVPQGWQVGRIVNFNKVVTIKIDKRKLIQEEAEKYANQLYEIFISGDFKSLRDFSRSKYYDKSHVSLIKLWKKYVHNFSNDVTQGKRFIPREPPGVAADC